MSEGSYSEETSSEYSESPKSSEGGLGGRLRLPSAGRRPFLPFFPPAMVHSEGEEAGKKKKANEREQVGREARRAGYLKRPRDDRSLPTRSPNSHKNSKVIQTA
jgi:hypothetical protein